MKNLLEISRIVSKKKLRKIEILDEDTLDNKSGKFSEFFEALMAGKFKNDRDAAAYLYDCSPTDDKYRQLKSRFRKRMLNTLFFLDLNLPGTSGYDRAYFSCNRDWTLVKILLANDASNTAEDLASQTLGTALRFKFADVVVNLARLLRKFASEKQDEAAFEENDRLLKQYANVMEAEIRSEELLQRVVTKYRTPAANLAALQEQIDTYCDALVGLSEAYDSPIVLYNMFLVWTYRYEMLHEFSLMLDVCGRAEKYIEENPLHYRGDLLATFQIKKMSAHLHLQDFKNGKLNAEKSLQTFPEGGETWFLFMEYYILLAFHTDNHIQAFAIFNRAKGHPKFKKLDAETREKWKLYEVYINYFLEGETEEESPLAAQAKKSFRLSRFLSDPVLYPKEQRVLTVHMVAAQMLFYLKKKNLPLAGERVDRLKSLANKQLNPAENQRMIQFIRLLVQLEKVDFQIAELTGMDKTYEGMVASPFFYRGLLNELEIVPYEKLWNHILAKLKK